jgi:hypothetical protein
MVRIRTRCPGLYRSIWREGSRPFSVACRHQESRYRASAPGSSPQPPFHQPLHHKLSIPRWLLATSVLPDGLTRDHQRQSFRSADVDIQKSGTCRVLAPARPQFLQESSTLISLMVPLRCFWRSHRNARRDRLLNRAGNRGEGVVRVRANETNSANH